ncbi:hypothetical protein [Brachybacterium sp. GPGPB12]|uniref:hypothetical protein n=1 Tax=Brachybacterium sp. GPGPB12 TaxID=3023517 RepID=UPI0031346198
MRIRLERLGPGHAEEILTGQDEALAREIIGRPWDRERLAEFLARARAGTRTARWSSSPRSRRAAAGRSAGEG